jgi:hypothetical protein
MVVDQRDIVEVGPEPLSHGVLLVGFDGEDVGSRIVDSKISFSVVHYTSVVIRDIVVGRRCAVLFVKVANGAGVDVGIVDGYVGIAIVTGLFVVDT